MDKKNEYLKKIDNITLDFLNQFENLNEEQINWKPNSAKWSTAQILEHIIKTNESYFSIPQEIKNGSYKLPITAKIPFLPNIFGKMILAGVNPNRKMKSKTFTIWEPSFSNFGREIFKNFENHQKELKKFIEENEDLIMHKTIISSPANRNLIYTFDTAINIIIDHEKRHYYQAKETLESFGD
ncbi:MAG: DinB family protein [Ignavibacteriae bacterium]|nr:DinB family protein [Ignavibacteriota bacterium]MCB9207209.1 DinB family protein [Ignavibacteriales bacterium]MCB9219108.1 DinB family protein [Ignavibacteriales bacterium]MCB9259690.1 DinB family protein [Ignavibacteriales bacterium]